ncbi:MAG: hypothetical protein V5A37_05845 [Halobacteriales archaeon]
MDTIGDLLTRDRRSDDVAVRAVGAGEAVATYTYEDFVTTAWKTGNFFSHRGAHAGAIVAVADDRAVPPLLSFFGAVQLGATVRFGRPVGTDGALYIAPGERILDADLAPGTSRIAYHGRPDEPAVEAFGESVWSENPVAPPESVAPDATALETDGRTRSHADLLARATDAAGRLSTGDTVVVREPLADPGVVVAGVLAPLHAGATIAFPAATDGGDVAVATGDAPEPRVIDPEAV